MCKLLPIICMSAMLFIEELGAKVSGIVSGASPAWQIGWPLIVNFAC